MLAEHRTGISSSTSNVNYNQQQSSVPSNERLLMKTHSATNVLGRTTGSNMGRNSFDPSDRNAQYLSSFTNKFSDARVYGSDELQRNQNSKSKSGENGVEVRVGDFSANSSELNGSKPFAYSLRKGNSAENISSMDLNVNANVKKTKYENNVIEIFIFIVQI